MSRPPPQAVERVAVLGAGTIGASWTALFLAHGLAVAVYDPADGTEELVRAFVARAWPALERLGLGANADPTRFTVHADPADAVAGAVLVQENGPENLAVKRELYARIEPSLAPDAVVASSTSGLMPSELQEGRIGPERYVVGHPFNPPHLIPLVEVVGGRLTDPAVVDWAVAFYAGLGKRPIRLHREVPAHVANRMQAALYREAIHLVLEGVADIAGHRRRDRLRAGAALGADGAAHGAPSGRRARRHAPPARAHRARHGALVGRSRPTAAHARGDRPAGRGVRADQSAAGRRARGRARRAAADAARDPRAQPRGARRPRQGKARVSRVAIVTGGSRGIGAATAKLLAAQGYDVAINYRARQAAAEAVAAAVGGHGVRALTVQADMAREADVLRLFETVDEELGRPAALVNNAGIVGPTGRLENVEAGPLRAVFELNVVGAILCAREAVRRMSTRRGGQGGAIVNLSSIAARMGSANTFVHYAASKAAIDALTIGLAREVGADGIRVNAVAPGLIDTEIHEPLGGDARYPAIIEATPLGRVGTADEVAEAIVWLLSDAASFVTGSVLEVGGGR